MTGGGAPPTPAGPDSGTEGLEARRAALRAIDRVLVDGAYSTAAVPAAVADLDTDRDRAFASHLAYDTLRWLGTLDWALARVLDRPLDDVEEDLTGVLRLGALQLLRTGVPAHAAVSTSVELARERIPRSRADGAAGFVNGVLRALSRRVDDLPWPAADADPVAHLALTTAHPRWIVEELLDRCDRDEVEALLWADDEPPGLTLRAVGDRDDLLAELADAGIDATPTRAARAGVRAPGADPGRIAAVAEGRAVPQDEASMLVVEAAGVSPGDRVLDLCAGPGGKTTHLAALAGGAGRVVAVELYPHRARRVAEAAARQDRHVEVLAADATALPIADDRRFDVVLVDAPCTGLGTGRRRPEVRWRRTPDDVAALADLQRRLLGVALRRVAPDGRVVYAACTWTAAETTAVAGAAAAEHGARLVDERQLLPHRDGTDGMYRAVLVSEGGDA